MNIENEIKRHIRLFHYFIIMTEEKAGKDTIFNRISRNLIGSKMILNTISHLPAWVDEYIGDWPNATMYMPYDINYQIHYIYESNTLQVVEMFKFTPFGCVFVMENVSAQTIETIRKVTQMPVVYDGEGMQGVLSLHEPNLVSILHKIWREQTKNWVSSIPLTRRQTWLPNKTKIKSLRAPSIAFLDPLTVSIDRIRGLYESTQKRRYKVNPCTADIFKEKEIEADKLINEYIRRILAEKLVTINMGYLQEGSFDDNDRYRLSLINITESNLQEIAKDKDDKRYNRIVDAVLNKWDKVTINSEFVLCVPSINYHLIDMLNKSLKKDKLPKKLLRQVYDHANYYQVVDATVIEAESEDKKVQNFIQLNGLIIERGNELQFLSSLHVLYSLARRVPYIRTRNVPASNFYRLAAALSAYSNDMEERNRIPDFTTGMKQISEHIQEAFHIETTKLIAKHASRVKVISDLPVEWMELEGLPLCVACNYSRVPITPGNGLISHSNTMNREFTLTQENIKVLMINALSKEDDRDKGLFRLGRELCAEINHYFKLIGKEIVYVETNDKKNFFETIEKEEPIIFIYYGHGSYDVNDMIGKLVIGNETVTAIELEQLSWKPIIALLGACETQVMHGTHLNVANLFMGSGCLSVLGTYFPVNGLHALSFIANILRHLVNCFANAAPEYLERWDDVILQTYRTQYLMDSMHAMDRYLERRGKKLSHYPVKPFQLFWERGKDKGYFNLVDFYRNRDEIFQEVFDTVPELGDAYRSILSNNLILPQSLYYSSLGSPDKIIIQRGQTVQTFEDVDNHYLGRFRN
ncbi:hypothetical protein BBG47_18800 [Paenibacillus sp. KS1]|uniref:CHAT domain-containing protein n=1 Tax=Paenibacillus sp. KS1 TaxID=1849249 RepID=UPI0008064A8C|nr:CHAT domain-containing protein [Paenibacillus sp. KS1]OBY77993.1 hypothetical protein BBG47_18800 [Paenibacillus sp. KS1]